LLMVGKPMWVFKLLLTAWTLRWWHQWMGVSDIKQLIFAMGHPWYTELNTFRPHVCYAVIGPIWLARSWKSEAQNVLLCACACRSHWGISVTAGVDGNP
jgi:hypothetical protein